LPVVLLPCIFIILLLIGLELAVAIIQAYVFILLCVLYLHDAKYLH
jgi:F0F1-type ATP synthase membrane subunit a